MAFDDPYANKAKLGSMIRLAAAREDYDESVHPELKRLNDIVACEAFISALANAGCMITRIPEDPNRKKD